MADESLRIWPPPPPERFGGRDAPGKEAEAGTVRERVIAALRQVYDPEIPVNIYDLGLVYKLEVDEPAQRVHVEMTLTTPNCPEAESLPGCVRAEVEAIPGVRVADVVLVWDPPWDRSRMSDDARLILGV